MKALAANITQWVTSHFRCRLPEFPEIVKLPFKLHRSFGQISDNDGSSQLVMKALLSLIDPYPDKSEHQR